MLNLLKLVINNCELKKIDASIFELCQLNHLDLSVNKISEIDNFKFSSLVELNLSQNEIKYIGKNVCLPKLVAMDLSNNQMVNLDRNFCINFKSVSKLRFNNNKLKNVYSKIGDYMTSLKHLYANNNEFVNLPYSFSYLRLEMLELHDNPFEYIIFTNTNKLDNGNQGNFPSLVELCARAIVDKK